MAQSAASKRTFSKPVLEQTFTIHSQNAQYVLQRGHSFLIVVRALYSISVVLRIIAEEVEMDQIEELVEGKIAAVAERLSEEQARLKTLADAEGGVAVPRYTSPREVRLQVSSPALAQYVRLILTLDQTLMLLDGLWFAGVLGNKPRKNLTYELRRLVYGLGRELIDLERRARESVVRAGKHEVMQEADSETNALVLATGSLIDEEGSSTPDASEDEDAQTDPAAAID